MQAVYYLLETQKHLTIKDKISLSNGHHKP